MNPDDLTAASALNEEGNQLLHAGHVDAAESRYRSAIDRCPTVYKPHANLGNIALRRGRIPEAVEHLRRAVALEPGAFRAQANLGAALASLGHLEEAEAAFRASIAARPDEPRTLVGLTRLLLARGRSDEAVVSARRATELDPTSADAFGELGLSLLARRQPAEAIMALRHAIDLDPRTADRHLALGAAHLRQMELDEAAEAFSRAIDLAPSMAEAHANLASVRLGQGEVDAAVALLERVVQMQPRLHDAHSNLLYAMLYRSRQSPDEIFEAHRAWDRAHALGLSAAPVARSLEDPDPERPIRVGYLSPDFRNHSVARFFEPLLTHRDRRSFSVTCLSNVAREDEVTARLRARADAWISVRGLSDEVVAERIAAERIDVLVDLAGHTGDGRLLVFARRPAPVQVTYLGYPHSTGLRAMDHRLVDPWVDPPGDADARCSETLVRLPESAWCYTPGEEIEPSMTPPSIARGYITFGSFNLYAKVSPESLRAWGEILRAVPRSRLLMKAKPLVNPGVARRARALLRAEGIDDARVDLRGWEPGRDDHLRLFDEVDVALDTFPYHGTTTTCDALWMGVPVVVRAGDAHVSRVGCSLLRSVGLEDLVARSHEEYVRRAIDLARDLPRLTSLRGSLRDRMRASALGDPQRFVPAFEEALRSMWRAYCARVSPR
jgi:protein O-GlcNAc transferase